MIDASKKYRTRSGNKVRIYAMDAGGNWPIHGAVFYPALRQWDAFSWCADGSFRDDRSNGMDLVEVEQAAPFLMAAE
jgi:hypothetical protein